MNRNEIVLDQSESGFTVINVLIALIIFSVVVVGLTSASLLATKNLRTGQEYHTAAMVAESKLDSLMALGWTSLAGELGSDTVWGHPVEWEVQGTNPREVTVIVEGKGDASIRADSFVTMVAR
jgi:type II secretion system protein I